MGPRFERHRRNECADPAPYPEIKVERKNPYYALVLMDDYAGIVSEFSAIAQYIYSHMTLEDKNKELSDTFKDISIVEMKHLDILGDLILELGGNPEFRGSYSTCGNYWCGDFVYYPKQECDAINAALDSEYKAIEEYREHIAIIKDKYVDAVLERIILDEKVHITIFKKAYKKYCPSRY